MGDRRRRDGRTRRLAGGPFEGVDPQRVVCRFDVSAVFDDEINDEIDDIDEVDEAEDELDPDLDADLDEDEDLEALEADR